ncbi:MAG: hypothetical protein GX350_03940 [Erysipelotrichaceae bacterium]|nr:hypothetical protein [Erysipelotrichaceae bacterium]
MAQSRKEKLNYRCPSCFMRDLDMDMFFDPNTKEYYCLRCNFSGDEERVLYLNEKAKFRYGLLLTRVEQFAPLLEEEEDD